MRTTRENCGEGFIERLTNRNPVGKPTGGQNLRTIRAIRRDHAGVSPVIATILMVAITVVLAAVLYVMVAGLVTGPGTTPRAIGVAIGKTGDGLSWQLTLSDVPSGKAPSSVFLTVFYANGTVAMSRTALSGLSGSASFVQIDSSATNIQAGDKILLTVSTYPAGSSFQLSDVDGILAQGALQ